MEIPWHLEPHRDDSVHCCYPPKKFTNRHISKLFHSLPLTDIRLQLPGYKQPTGGGLGLPLCLFSGDFLHTCSLPTRLQQLVCIPNLTPGLHMCRCCLSEFPLGEFPKHFPLPPAVVVRFVNARAFYAGRLRETLEQWIWSPKHAHFRQKHAFRIRTVD